MVQPPYDLHGTLTLVLPVASRLRRGRRDRRVGSGVRPIAYLDDGGVASLCGTRLGYNWS